jgi:ATP-dependent helicase/DNAse subunit B
MPPILYLAPSTGAALEHAAAQARAFQQGHPLAPVCLLLPDQTAIQAMRRRLGSAVNVRLDQFYGLAQAVLDAAGVESRGSIFRLSEAGVRRLVRQLLEEMHASAELTSFAPVWHKPGFQAALFEWLREMKSQGIPPEAVAAEQLESGADRDRQLALFYGHYASYLQAGGFSDTDGLLWLAAEALEGDGELMVTQGPLLVLGFDQFNPLQYRILQALSGRFEQLAVYLLWDSSRPPGSLALARLDETRVLLEATLSAELKVLEAPSGVHPALRAVSSSVFEISTPDIVPTKKGGKVPDPIRFVAAPSRESEVRWALREIKRLLLDGIAADEIALLAPQPGWRLNRLLTPGWWKGWPESTASRWGAIGLSAAARWSPHCRTC